MVATLSPSGLIATTRAALTPQLDELATSCRWPVVLEATPRRLQRELASHSPECLVFWLDELAAIEPIARLITWARQRGARPLRVAVACDIAGDAESTLRAAGAHGFLSLHGLAASAASDALQPLLQGAAIDAAAMASRSPIAATRGHPFTAASQADHAHPP